MQQPPSFVAFRTAPRVSSTDRFATRGDRSANRDGSIFGVVQAVFLRLRAGGPLGPFVRSLSGGGCPGRSVSCRHLGGSFGRARGSFWQHELSKLEGAMAPLHGRKLEVSFSSEQLGDSPG